MAATNFDVQLTNLSGGIHGYGIDVDEFDPSSSDNNGLFISDILFGSAAAKDGNIQKLDRVICVNGERITGLSTDAAVKVLVQACMQPTMHLSLQRPTLPATKAAKPLTTPRESDWSEKCVPAGMAVESTAAVEGILDILLSVSPKGLGVSINGWFATKHDSLFSC